MDIKILAAALSSTALVSFACASAQAQTVPAGQSETVPGIETVTVTVEKRVENLTDVPASVTAISGQRLNDAGVTAMDQLAQMVPGLHMDSSGPFLEPTIRGVGTAVDAPGASSNVPIYVDGFYRPNALSNDMNFIDVDDIQVLKGPQGTLFGRNATGGAILVTTMDPSFDPSLNARVGYGTFNTAEASVVATDGITDTLAGSIMVGAGSTDGFIRNVFNGRRADEGSHNEERGKLLFEPSSHLKFILTVDHSYQDDPTPNDFSPYRGYTTGVLFGAPIVNTRGKIDENAPLENRSETQGVSLRGEADLGFATLTSLSSARQDISHEAVTYDATSVPLAASHWKVLDHNWSQEFDLTSKGDGPFNWVTGLYYFYDWNEYANFDFSTLDPVTMKAGPYVPLWNAGQSSTTYAAFADGTYNIFSNLYLTLGARYSIDRASEFFATFPITGYTTASHDWYSFTPRAVLRYQLTPDSDVYVSWSKGNKAGIYNPDALGTTPVNPETITAFEGGYKISKPDWQFEAAAYHDDYKNLQVEAFYAGSAFIQNAASAEIYGGEAHLVKLLGDNLKLDIGGAYTHARYTSFDAAQVFGFTPALGVFNYSANVSGDDMERTPGFNGSLALDYSHPLFGGGLDLGAYYSYQTKVYFDVNEGAYQAPYGILNLRAAWTDPDNRWTASVSGLNVTNTKYLSQVLESGATFGQVYGQPATVYFQIALHY